MRAGFSGKLCAAAGSSPLIDTTSIANSHRMRFILNILVVPSGHVNALCAAHAQPGLLRIAMFQLRDHGLAVALLHAQSDAARVVRFDIAALLAHRHAELTFALHGLFARLLPTHVLEREVSRVGDVEQFLIVARNRGAVSRLIALRVAREQAHELAHIAALVRALKARQHERELLLGERWRWLTAEVS